MPSSPRRHFFGEQHELSMLFYAESWRFFLSRGVRASAAGIARAPAQPEILGVAGRTSAGDPAASDSARRIWVDADACPNVIKDILFRAAERAGIELTLVANRWIHPTFRLHPLHPGQPGTGCCEQRDRAARLRRRPRGPPPTFPWPRW